MPPRHDSFIGRGFVALTTALTSASDASPSQIAGAKNAGITGAGASERTKWVHVAPFGEWSGHSEGSFKLAREHFDAICSQVASRATPISFDYEHASIRAKGEPTPAAGYILTTEVRDDGLYALTEFTPRAWGMISGGEYRFCSGVFDFEATDAKTAEPLVCALDTVALTNRPFLDGQHPIAMSRRALSSGVTMKEIDLKALAKLLDAIPGPNTAEKMKKAIDLMAAGDAPEAPVEAPKADASKPVPKVAPKAALTEDAPAVALADPSAAPAPVAPTSMDPMPMADAAVADATADNDVDAKLMAATGLDEEGLVAALLANFDAVVGVLMGTADTGATALSRDLIVKGKDAQIVELTRERNELRTREGARIERDAGAEIDALIKRMPLLATERASMLSLARTKPSEFRAMAKALAPASVDLTRPHASALAQPAPESLVTVQDDHPLIAATRASLSKTNLPEDVQKRALENVRLKLAQEGN